MLTVYSSMFINQIDKFDTMNKVTHNLNNYKSLLNMQYSTEAPRTYEIAQNRPKYGTWLSLKLEFVPLP